MELEIKLYVDGIPCPKCGSKDFSGRNEDDIRVPGEMGAILTCYKCNHEQEVTFNVTLKEQIDL